MRVQEDDKWKIVFCTRYSKFVYKIISFGFSNTLANFQDYINKIFTKKLDIFVIVYLNDILNYTKDLD